MHLCINICQIYENKWKLKLDHILWRQCSLVFYNLFGLSPGLLPLLSRSLILQSCSPPQVSLGKHINPSGLPPGLLLLFSGSLILWKMSLGSLGRASRLCGRLPCRQTAFPLYLKSPETLLQHWATPEGEWPWEEPQKTGREDEEVGENQCNTPMRD